MPQRKETLKRELPQPFSPTFPTQNPGFSQSTSGSTYPAHIPSQPVPVPLGPWACPATWTACPSWWASCPAVRPMRPACARTGCCAKWATTPPTCGTSVDESSATRFSKGFQGIPRDSKGFQGIPRGIKGDTRVSLGKVSSRGIASCSFAHLFVVNSDQ